MVFEFDALPHATCYQTATSLHIHSSHFTKIQHNNIFSTEQNRLDDVYGTKQRILNVIAELDLRTVQKRVMTAQIY